MTKDCKCIFKQVISTLVHREGDFSKKFEAYKQFDIYFCRHYNNTRFKMNPQQYSAKILEFKLEFSPSITAKAMPQTNTFRGPSQTSHSSNRYEPYDHNKASGMGSSFPRVLIRGPRQVSALSAEGLGIVGVTALTQPLRKEFVSRRAGKMVESSSLLQELSHASNGTSKQIAKIITAQVSSGISC